MRRLGVVGFAVVTGLLACDVGESPSVASISFAANQVDPIRISIPIKGRKLANEAQKLIRITQGDLLELVFTADEAAELHLHGYDIYLNVKPGTPGVLRVDAKFAGRFPLEAHRFGNASAEPNVGTRAHVVLLYLEIYPR
jgi:hypothetical protein